MSFWGIVIILLFVIGFVWGIYTFIKESKFSIYKTKYFVKKYERDLVDKVRWIVIQSYVGSIGSHGTYREVRDRELFKYIEREQHQLQIQKIYCIDFSNEEEKTFVCEILENHKQSIIKSFFCDSLNKEKEIYNLTNLEYYMFHLMGFLQANGHIDKFKGENLYHHLQIDGNYKTYKLTDYGVIYYKLYYIVTLFCANNENIKFLFTDSEHTLNGIKKDLENGEIKFWSYRP